MHPYIYQIDSELKVVEDLDGSRELGVAKRVKAPSDALQNHVNAVKEFKDGMETLLEDFIKEIDGQESEIGKQIEHAGFFLHEFKDNKWDANPMFDRLRLLYTSQIDSLRKEKRQLRIRRIEKKMSFMKELLDTKKELSPFSKLF